MSSLDARSLPPDARARLETLSRGGAIEAHAALTRTSRRVLVRVVLLVLFGLVPLVQWLALYRNLFGGYKGYADDDDFLLSTPLAVLGGLLAIHALLGLIALSRSRLRPALVVTPALLVVVGRDDEPVEAVQHDAVARWSIDGHTVRAHVPGGVLEARAEDGAAARRFVEAAELAARQAKAFPADREAHDWVPRARPPSFSFAPIGRFATALLVSVSVIAPLSFAMWVAGFVREERERWAAAHEDEGSEAYRYRDLVDRAPNDFPPFVIEALGLDARGAEVRALMDARAARESEAEFARAMAQGSLFDLRIYVVSSGATHVAEARARIAELYRARAARYREEAAASGANAGLTEAMARILVAAGERDDGDIGLSIRAHPMLDPSRIDAALAALAPQARIVPIAPVLSPQLLASREEEVAEAVRAATSSGLGGYLYVRDHVAADGPRLEVSYRIEPTGSVYSDVAQAALPESEQTLYPGLRVVFECAAVVAAGEASSGAVQIVAEPSPDLQVVGYDGSLVGAVYDRMLDSAFAELRRQLVLAFGGTPAVEPPPTF